MDYAEFWFLENAIEMCVPFRFVDGPRIFLEAQWYKAWHGLDRARVLDTLERLQAAGTIVVQDENSHPVVLSRNEFNRENEKRADGRAEKDYGLTSSGGARWEVFAEADWDRYHSFEWDEEVLEIAATTPETAERAFRYSVPFNELRAHPETVTRGEFRPWAVTYWKTLPVGYFIRCRCEYFANYEEMEDYFRRGLSEQQAREAAQHVLREHYYFRSWYKKHPDTPKMEPFC